MMRREWHERAVGHQPHAASVAMRAEGQVAAFFSGHALGLGRDHRRVNGRCLLRRLNARKTAGRVREVLVRILFNSAKADAPVLGTSVEDRDSARLRCGAAGNHGDKLDSEASAIAYPSSDDRDSRLITRIGLFFGASLVLVSGCASAVSTAGVSSTPVERPADPAGWSTVASSDGRVELVVPPDLLLLEQPSGVLVQGEFRGVGTPIQIWVSGPRDLPDQPSGSESAREWLVRTGWLPQAGKGGVTTSGESEAEILLPQGRAYRAALTANSGTEAASRVIVYAISTSKGVAVLQILGDPETVQARAAHLNLVPLLVTFND